MISTEEAIRVLAKDRRYAAQIYDSYLGQEVTEAGDRFWQSAEFAAVRQVLGSRIAGAAVLDVGAGTGIGSYAFARAGAGLVYALEPDPSDLLGQGAIKRLTAGLPVELLTAWGESIPLPDAAVDIVYGRQVLHHAQDLPKLLAECARVLKPGGCFLACREHVANNEQERQAFLKRHPVHQLAGGENAFRLDEYTGAVTAAGLTLEKVLGPWDSTINAFPAVRSEADLRCVPRKMLEYRFGKLGRLVGSVPGVQALLWLWLRRPYGGRMYTFVARKPG